MGIAQKLKRFLGPSPENMTLTELVTLAAHVADILAGRYSTRR